MKAVQESMVVGAPVERAWQAVVDFEARPRFSSRVKEASVLDGQPLKEGSRIQLQVGRDRFHATVLDVRPPERLSLLVQGPGFRVMHVYEVRAASNGTSVSITGEYGGPMGLLAAYLMKGSVRRDLTDELAAIKQAAEAP